MKSHPPLPLVSNRTCLFQLHQALSSSGLSAALSAWNQSSCPQVSASSFPAVFSSSKRFPVSSQRTAGPPSLCPVLYTHVLSLCLFPHSRLSLPWGQVLCFVHPYSQCLEQCLARGRYSVNTYKWMRMPLLLNAHLYCKIPFS